MTDPPPAVPDGWTGAWEKALRRSGDPLAAGPDLADLAGRLAQVAWEG